MTEFKQAVDSAPEAAPAGMSLNDIYFILFRRKWIILFCFLLGLAAAAAIVIVRKPLYRSDSKLLVRYVVENKAPMPLAENTQVRSGDSSGSSVITSEIEILTSVDLYVQVAEAIGPARILQAVGGGDDKLAAAGVIAKGITVEPPKGNIIKVTFHHQDPQIITPVLERLIDEYLKRHAEIHRGLDDVVLSQQADELRFQLNQTEEELRQLKSTNNVISLEETKAAYIEEMSSLRRELNTAEALLAEARAMAGVTTANLRTNSASTNQTAAIPEIPADVLRQYNETMLQLAGARQGEFALASQYSDDNALVKRARELVADIDHRRKDLETKYPALLHMPVSAPTSLASSEALSLAQERTRAVALEAKVQTLTTQLEKVRQEAARLDAIESRIKQLQRKRDLDEQNYRYFAAGLERSRFDEALGSSRNSNIGIVQNPTPPWQDDKKRMKMIAVALGGGLGFGLALAFFLELFLDQSVRRVEDVERRLHVPLFMAVPYVNGKAMRRFAAKERKRLADAPANGNTASSAAAAAAVSDPEHPLRPMFDGLRDRALLHLKALAHKPKLVGVSTCSDGAGASTIAAGLAAALSETGEGKVLLLDVHQPQGAAHPFFKGKNCQIEDVLEGDKREAGLVQENLYVATANGSFERRLGALSRQLSTLMPKFKASDYDFIILDMPGVSSTSVSLRLATMLDVLLLVVESEKVPAQTVKQAHSLLHNAGVDAQVVLNKVRRYVPTSLGGGI